MVCVGDIADVFDGPHATPKKLEKGPYFLSISSLNKGALDLSQSAHLSEEDFKKWTKRVTPESGDILFSYETRLGEAAIMPPGIRACLGRRMGLLRPDRTKVLPEYLLYAYLSPDFQSTIEQRKIHGATVDRIALKELPSFPIRVPNIVEQQLVVDNLKALDAKIQLNHQINQTLEQIAQAIFKSWFVDFEPVKTKIAARQRWHALQPVAEPASPVCYADDEVSLPDLETFMNLAAMQAISGKDEEQLAQMQAEQPEEYAELLATAELFPSAMQESELGQIPQGWGVESLSSFVEITMGQSPKSDTYNSNGIGTPLVNGPVEFGSHHPLKIKWTTAPSKISARGDLIVCVRGSTTGRFVKSDGEYCLGRGVCSIRAHTLQPYVDRLFQNELPTLLGLATGSTFPSWSGPTLKNHRVLVPRVGLMKKFGRLFGPIDYSISSRVRESESLAILRDVLLPKLISGELSLPGLRALPQFRDFANV